MSNEMKQSQTVATDRVPTDEDEAVALKAATLLSEARKRFTRAVAAERENRCSMIEDLKFRAGQQWPEDIVSQRHADQRPCLTINRIPQFVRQVMGDIRSRRPSIRINPVDNGADKKIARIYEGLIRQIEYKSNARAAYMTAAEYQVTSGYGVIRVGTQYASESSFDQEACISRIANPFTIYFDPDASDSLKRDARFAFETELVDRETFVARFPHARPIGLIDQGDGIADEKHYIHDTIRIAAYWRKEPQQRLLGLMSDGRSIELDGMSDVELERLRAKGELIRTRVVQGHRVVRYLISGAEILEGPMAWPSRDIPLVPVYGEEINIEGRTRYHGIVRYAKDPQRMYNYWSTTGVETIALQPRVPYLLTPEQVRGHESRFNAANKANVPYLLYNPDSKAPPPQRQSPPQPVQAVFTERAAAQEDMKATTGIYDAALGQSSNETSGRAILLRRNEVVQGNAVYIDKLSDAIGQVGRILVDLIPSIYDTTREVRVRGEDGADQLVMINTSSASDLTADDGSKGGAPFGHGADTRDDEINNQGNDLARGQYDVVVTTGPSHATQRLEAADTMLQFVRAVPEASNVIADLIAQNMDWPGADEIAARLRRVLPAGILQEPVPVNEADELEYQKQVAIERDIKRRRTQIDNAQAALAVSLDETALHESLDAAGLAPLDIFQDEQAG